MRRRLACRLQLTDDGWLPRFHSCLARLGFPCSVYDSTKKTIIGVRRGLHAIMLWLAVPVKRCCVDFTAAPVMALLQLYWHIGLLSPTTQMSPTTPLLLWLFLQLILFGCCIGSPIVTLYSWAIPAVDTVRPLFLGYSGSEVFNNSLFSWPYPFPSPQNGAESKVERARVNQFRWEHPERIGQPVCQYFLKT